MRSPIFLVIAFAVSVTVASAAMLGNAQEFSPQARLVPQTEQAALEASQSDMRAAVRLQKRVTSRFGFTPPVQVLLHDMQTQRDLLSRSVTITFVPDDAAIILPWTSGVDRFLRVDVTPAGIRSTIDAGKISSEFAARLPEGIRLPASATILSRTTEDGIARIETDGIAKSGYDFDANAVAELVTDAFLKNEQEVSVSLNTRAGTVSNATGEDLGTLELLASGRSNFEGSGNGRKNNVRKGLTKYIHNLIVEPNEEFSINRILKEVPIREWEMALGIFGGGELRPVAGGGLCQVATTLYRGILNAGLPVTKRANHSLFVHYYEKYGVGLDATIFPASAPDLRFVNDTGKPLVIQSYVEGDEATLNIYGTPDGRTVQMTGPYFAENAPEDFLVNGKKLTSREIAWVRDVTYQDGRIDQYVSFSRYKSIPRSVVKEYSDSVASKPVNLHAVAQQKPPLAEADLNASVQVQ